MQVSQYILQQGSWSPSLPENSGAQWVLGFGGQASMNDCMDSVLSAFPQADVVGCTTSGEILGSDVYDETLVLTAIEFATTRLCVIAGNLKAYSDSAKIGAELAKQLDYDGLRAVLVISDGQVINGSDLVDGITAQLPHYVSVSGGLAGDGDRFNKTTVWHNRRMESGLVLLCGLYGDQLNIGYGSIGGWTPFGPDREITRAENNVLYELDHQPALDLYRRYLGEFAKELPGAALRFPLNLTLPEESESVVRTILNINEDEKSMTFAGNMPEGAKVRLMKASVEALVDGAQNAAVYACDSLNAGSPELALLISCVGRRLVLGQRVFEELESVDETIGKDCPICGFYSYGEISPLLATTECKLHNQTMTITTFSEQCL